MKNVYITFYSAGNFGDDFFIKIISDYFSNVKFSLLINPKYKIKKLSNNVKILWISSYMITISQKICSLLSRKSQFGNISKKILETFMDFTNNTNIKRADAVVRIGGSILMEHSDNKQEIDFCLSSDTPRDYSIRCKVKSKSSKQFIIGANFGPYYGASHLHWVENVFSKCENVCLRDFSSYNLFRHLDNVQYAPDTVFLHQPICMENKVNKKVLISLIDPSRNEKEKKFAEKYYLLIKESILTLINRGYTIDLVSFCDKEGDKNGIEKVVSMLPSEEKVFIHSYNGDVDEILELFKTSDFVIGTRFHSIILGIIYEKPTFPIAYSCKTINYLMDLNFVGKYARLDELDKICVEDVLYNFEKNIVCPCQNHKKYAKNQFYALERYLNDNFDDEIGVRCGN